MYVYVHVRLCASVFMCVYMRVMVVTSTLMKMTCYNPLARYEREQSQIFTRNIARMHTYTQQQQKTKTTQYAYST